MGRLRAAAQSHSCLSLILKSAPSSKELQRPSPGPSLSLSGEIHLLIRHVHYVRVRRNPPRMDVKRGNHSCKPASPD
jgi:hypothetical protein